MSQIYGASWQGLTAKKLAFFRLALLAADHDALEVHKGLDHVVPVGDSGDFCILLHQGNTRVGALQEWLYGLPDELALPAGPALPQLSALSGAQALLSRHDRLQAHEREYIAAALEQLGHLLGLRGWSSAHLTWTPPVLPTLPCGVLRRAATRVPRAPDADAVPPAVCDSRTSNRMFGARHMLLELAA
ncbi:MULTISPECIES: hypothetical protein [unclassified Streptomyces]|uniref:hypothetical protein n=1 Tax=unclassified Streptomyces TaxID=2593676 RepID=UPI000DC753F7|nr:MULTISPECIES: hypothetical protein [unclassified Streptomyces]AWZ09173.1 hypothetical protein DRB89_36940 [Streptomyces sp. ICC4]AWZ16877.1 hypothetical protein DRB96_37145 [Streptomyces sp. ICC1]